MPEQIKIPRSVRRTLCVHIEGVSPLMVHRFGESSIAAIEAKQQKIPKAQKGPRDPEEEYIEAMYYLRGTEFGIPAGAFAEAIVNASVDIMLRKKSMLRRNFYVLEDGHDDRDGTALIKLNGSPKMHKSIVRLSGPSRPADVRYRPIFELPWGFMAKLRFNPKAFSAEQMLQLIQTAGESIGLCEGRPEKTLALGGLGRFRITNAIVEQVEQ